MTRRETRPNPSRQRSVGAKARKTAARRPASATDGKRKPKEDRKRTGPAAAGTAANILIVNMIPKALSAEDHQDSEPHLTVNPNNPSEIAATAFTVDPGGSSNAPIYLSSDGGRTWTLNAIVPSAVGSATHDITTSFSGTQRRLYAGILRATAGDLEQLGTKDVLLPTAMKIFGSRLNADQPFTHAATVANGPDKGRERVYIGVNDFNGPNGRSATIDQSLDAGAASPAFSSIRIETRQTSGQNGPQIRPVAHADGTVYAVYYGWRATTGNFAANTFRVTSADVVVVRDDNWGNGAQPFTALVDPNDGLPGNRIVQKVAFPFMRIGTPATGLQRLGGSLSIAVNPNDSATVYVAYAEQSTSMLTLHLRRSVDRGRRWSQDLLKIDDTTNGAVAVSNGGIIGFLYQQLVRSGTISRWRTILARSKNGVNWTNLVLADTPVDPNEKQFDPHLGDYVHLLAVGPNFYGIFSASNKPDLTHFPNGVTYQRNADFTKRLLLRLNNTTPVQSSIDPFFFRVAEA